MVLKSYAKINLTLSINNKLKSGLHNIQSIYCLIDLHDKMFLKKIKNRLYMYQIDNLILEIENTHLKDDFFNF